MSWSEALFEQLASALEHEGIAVLPEALPLMVATALHTYVQSLRPVDFHLAGVGRGDELIHTRAIRSNQIHWLKTENAGLDAWFSWTEALRLYLNRRLFLGLFEFESHIARYAPGDRYQRHVDAFRGGPNRILSLVTYLNRDWLNDEGGQLVVYTPEQPAQVLHRVLPADGTVVCFLSEKFTHEVLPASRLRHSVSGWFHVNSANSLPGLSTPEYPPQA
ncbi:MAG: 2OG-Fe(II) oxygenase [Gammaproteobacteria bacterium]